MQKIILYAVIFLVLFGGCNDEPKLPASIFEEISGEQVGIAFKNTILESESFNIIDYLYYYNGGGIGVGDINNDSLPDIYLASNEGIDRLFINQGNLQFKDITEQAGLKMDVTWSTGVSMADINQDGLLDIYVCKLGNYKGKKATNLLYINQGDGTFRDEAKEYGLDFSGFSTQAAFFDYDKDGDLDCYLLNHSVKSTSQFRDSKIRYEISALSGDRLYENINGVFTDVSKQAGIYSSEIGFGLGIKIADLNDDGWEDIYVGNDFHENDYIYLNQHNGTFREVAGTSMGHSSQFTMGVDIADLNNDGKQDIFTLDMRPDKEAVFKSSGEWESIEIFNFKQKFGFEPQLPRNNLQIYKGLSDGLPFYEEVACLHKVAATDWSWSTKLADFDLNGYRDIVVANGILRRPNDLDFIDFISNQVIQQKAPDSIFMSRMPKGLESNMIFMQSKDGFKAIPISKPNISNALATGDFDGDGDLDIITNNTNDFPSLYVNKSIDTGAKSIGFQDYDFSCLGCKITLHHREHIFLETLHPVHGFQSCSEPKVLFSTTAAQGKADSMVVVKPSGERFLLLKPIAGKTYSLNDFVETKVEPKQATSNQHFDTLKVPFIPYAKNQQQSQPLLLFNPPIYKPFFKQIPTLPTWQALKNGGLGGGLYIVDFKEGTSKLVEGAEEMGAFDIDIGFDTKSAELLILRMYPLSNKNPVLLRGTLKDNRFERLSEVTLPTQSIYSHFVMIDTDTDGDNDILVLSSYDRKGYGFPPTSYLIENKGTGYEIVQELDLGMVTSSSKVNENSVVIAGHWMPIKQLSWQSGRLEVDSIPNSSGLWEGIQVDFGKDSIIVAGNMGQNNLIPLSEEKPFKLYVKDIDNNGTIEQLYTYYKEGDWYPYHPKRSIISQLPHKKKSFLKNRDYSQLSFYEVFTEIELKGSQLHTIGKLASGFFKKEKGDWVFYPFGKSLQQGPIRVLEPVNGRYLVAGNLLEFDPSLGTQDALTPTILSISATGATPEASFLTREEIYDVFHFDNQWFLLNRHGQILLPKKFN